MANLIAATARALNRRPGTDVQARAPVAIGPRHQVPTTATNLFAASEATRALHAYRASSAVYSIVLRRASDAARIPWALYRNTPSAEGVDDNRTEIPDHAMLRVWRRPNPTYQKTGRAFRQIMLMWLDIIGEATAVVTTWGPGRMAQPSELWPVRPDRLAPIPDPYNGIAGWIHTSEDGEQTPLRDDQVLQIKYPNPLDPLRGLSPVLATMIEIDASILSAEWFRDFYLNSAQPGGIVGTDEHLTRGDMDEWILRWNEQHGGPGNAHRVALMDKGAKWMGSTMSMVDQQFVELNQMTRGHVREAFGMPKTIMGQTEDVNRATADAAQVVYARYGLQDRIDLLGEMANVELLPRYSTARVPAGAPPKYCLEPAEDVVPADREADNAERDSRVGAFAAVVDRGGDPDETLKAFGLPRITVTKPASPPQLGQPDDDGGDGRSSSPGGRRGPNTPPEADPDGTEPTAAARIMRIVAQVRDDIDPLDLLDDDDNPDQPLPTLQNSWDLALTALLADYAEIEADIKDGIVAQLEQHLTAAGLDGLERLTVDTTAVAERLQAAMEQVAVEAAADMIDDADADGHRVAEPDLDLEALARAARGVAQILGNRLASSAKGAVLRSWSADNDA
jgi:HK97 family phage portal protein